MASFDEFVAGTLLANAEPQLNQPSRRDKTIISFERNQSTFQQLLTTLGHTHEYELDEQTRQWQTKLEKTRQLQQTTEQQLQSAMEECRQLRAELGDNQDRYRTEHSLLENNLKEAQEKIYTLEIQQGVTHAEYLAGQNNSMLSRFTADSMASQSVINSLSDHERFEQIVNRLSKEDAQIVRRIEHHYKTALEQARHDLEKQKRKTKRVEHDKDELKKRYRCKNEEWDRWRQWFTALQKEHKTSKRTSDHLLSSQLTSHPPCPSVEQISQTSKENGKEEAIYDISFDNSSSMEMAIDVISQQIVDESNKAANIATTSTAAVNNHQNIIVNNEQIGQQIIYNEQLIIPVTTPKRSTRVLDQSDQYITPRKRKTVPTPSTKTPGLDAEIDEIVISETGKESNKRSRTIDVDAQVSPVGKEQTPPAVTPTRKPNPVILIIDGVSEVIKPAMRSNQSPKRSPRRAVIPRNQQGMPLLNQKSSRMIHSYVDYKKAAVQRAPSDNIEGFV
ncbi:hypothetical protein BDF19DRAFT_447575, partial [Syncephalis fuscata]